MNEFVRLEMRRMTKNGSCGTLSGAKNKSNIDNRRHQLYSHIEMRLFNGMAFGSEGQIVAQKKSATASAGFALSMADEVLPPIYFYRTEPHGGLFQIVIGQN